MSVGCVMRDTGYEMIRWRGGEKCDNVELIDPMHRDIKASHHSCTLRISHPASRIATHAGQHQRKGMTET